MKKLKTKEEGFSRRVEGMGWQRKNAGGVLGRKMNSARKMRKK